MDATALQENLESLGFTLCLLKSEIRKQLKNEGLAHKTTVQNESG